MSQLPEKIEEAIKPIRAEIDAIDTQLVELLNKRAECARAVGKIKSTVQAPVFRPERESDVIRNVVSRSRGPITPESMSGIFREIMSACRALERTISVAYLGPKGTFSEMAMERQFGSSVQGIPCDRIEEVFRAVEAGTAQFGVVPVENSTEGSVNRTMDSLMTTSLTIIGECSIPIHHNLLTQRGTLEGVKRIYSHPQSLGQCVGWLNANAHGIERIPVTSNGEAARLAATDPESAAIAGERAAAAYCLRITYAHIQDDASNRTRFIVLSSHGTLPSKAPGKDKSSFIFALDNEVGALFRALEILDRHGVSMTRLESRPAKNGTWTYYFYLDVEGHCKDQNIQKVIEELREAASFFKFLGSYPAEPDFRKQKTE